MVSEKHHPSQALPKEQLLLSPETRVQAESQCHVRMPVLLLCHYFLVSYLIPQNNNGSHSVAVLLCHREGALLRVHNQPGSVRL